MSTELPPAAWYPSPGEYGWLRYWDGSAWTEHRWASPPTGGQPTRGGVPVGKQLLRASFGLLQENRRMVWLPVISGVASAVVFLAISGAVALPLWRADGPSPWAVLYFFPGIMAASFVGVYFNVRAGLRRQ